MKNKIVFISGLDTEDPSWYFPPLSIKPDATINTSALKCDGDVFKVEAERLIDENTIVVCHSFGAFVLLHSDAKPKCAVLLDPSIEFLTEEMKSKIPEPFNSQMEEVYRHDLKDYPVYGYKSYELNTNHAFEDEKVCKMISEEIEKLLEK